MKTTLGVAIAGLILGAVAVPLAMAAFAPLGFLVFAALVGLAAVRKGSRAFAGGVLMVAGLWFVYFVRQAVERCDAIDRDPRGSCSISGTEEQLALAALVVVVGVLLVAVAVRKQPATA